MGKANFSQIIFIFYFEKWLFITGVLLLLLPKRDFQLELWTVSLRVQRRGESSRVSFVCTEKKRMHSLNSLYVRCNFCKPLPYLFCNWIWLLRLEIWTRLGFEIDRSGHDLHKRGDCLFSCFTEQVEVEMRGTLFRQANRNSIPNTGKKTWSIIHHLLIMIMLSCYCQRSLYLAVKISTGRLIIPR